MGSGKVEWVSFGRGFWWRGFGWCGARARTGCGQDWVLELPGFEERKVPDKVVGRFWTDCFRFQHSALSLSNFWLTFGARGCYFFREDGGPSANIFREVVE